MTNSDRLAQVTAMLVERDDDFRPLDSLKIPHRDDEHVWRVLDLQIFLGYDNFRQFENVINRAKIAAGKAEWVIRDHFIDGDLFHYPGEVLVTKYAAMLIIFNADPSKGRVGIAQAYFALQCDRQQFEDEKRVRTRFEVTQENRKLSGVAQDAGVEDFKKFNGMGIAGLYGGLTARQIAVRKGLRPDDAHLDFAGSEELAANLFRITQTAAALRRQIVAGPVGETAACDTHARVGRHVRHAILQAGNLPPEELPAAEMSIDRTATAVKKVLTAKKVKARTKP